MPRKVNIRWESESNAWRADVGFRGANERRKAKYFREIPHTAKGLRLAEEACKTWIAERDAAESRGKVEASDPTLYEGLVKPFLEELIRRVAREELGNQSLRSYKERLSRLLDFIPEDGIHGGVPLQNRRLSTITDDDGQAFIDSMRREGKSAIRIRGVVGAAKTMFGWGAASVSGRVPKRILASNPFADLKVSAIAKPQRRLPTTQEAARFFRAARREIEPFGTECGRCAGCKKAHRRSRCRRSHNTRTIHYRVLLVLFRLQVYAGTRPSELCGATWGPTARHPDIGWSPMAWQEPDSGHWWGMLTVWGKTTRATSRLRRIVVPPVLVRAIERIRRAGLHDVYIFPRLNRGGVGCWTVEGIDRHVRRWRNSARIGPHFIPYNFRHRMYTRAIHAGGLTTDQAGAVGGTAGPTVAATYLQPVDAELFRHAAIIGRAGRKD